MKIENGANPLKFVLVTQSRDALCEVATSLFSAMPYALFEDRKNPVVITIRGSFNSGKTIFPDFAREALVPNAVCIDKAELGKHRLDEYYEGVLNGQPFQLTFLNASSNRFFLCNPTLQDVFCREGEREITFINLRKHGGLTFIHNSDDSVMESSIDIWLEDGIHSVERTAEQSRLQLSKDEELKALFAQQAVEASWKRYSEISVFDNRLLSDENFMNALHQLENVRRIETVKQNYPKAPKLIPTA